MVTEELRQGFETAFIDYRTESNLAYRPEFVSNNYKTGQKVLSSLEQELAACDSFVISVAFITMGGIAPLLQTLKELKNRGVQGKILTTNYQTFSDPKALEILNGFPNIEVRMFVSDNNENGFHTKGYIFYDKGIVKTIIGSSNLTQKALASNREWNTRFVSTENGEMIGKILDEFKMLWNEAKPLAEVLEAYKRVYEQKKEVIKHTKVLSIQQYQLQPNSMQLAFIDNLRKIVDEGESRALLISATGTGKTYASAFAMRDQNPQKVLFVVHREQIAKQALKSYRNVFGDTKREALLSGNTQDFSKIKSAEYLFSTMQMMSKANIMTEFKPDEFDIIVIDEVHRAGADSYQRIMEYFKPRLWLGMTASPDRTDGFDIYELFHHNIAYEIRLQKALEENLLCPFHYYGITDIQIEGRDIGDDFSNFNLLSSDKRVDYVLENAKYYGYSGNRVKGLIFCSRKEEGKLLSEQFNKRGYRTVFLAGQASQEEREDAISRLVSDDRQDYLDYIFSVDIFNEGVDIPEVNQVIMLRPTQSPIVFVQQLGRGLRKADDKEYVVVLDFIGNYANNFMIPIALSGDRSYNKDNLRRYVMEGNRVIPGCSTIHFDAIAKERIFNSINEIKGVRKIIRESYRNLKFKLGHIPSLIDFYDNGEIDPLLILSEYKTYPAFLQCEEADYSISLLSQNEIVMLEYLSRIIARGKRPEELEILSTILEKGSFWEEEIKDRLHSKYGISDNEYTFDSAIAVLNGNFVTNDAEKAKYSRMDILDKNELGLCKRMQSFYERIQHMEFKNQLQDLVTLGLRRYQDLYSSMSERRGVFVLYKKYSRRDVCWLLNWGKDFSSTMYGMKRMDEDVAVFVTYHKADSKDEREYIDGKPDYADQFLSDSRQIFMWDSQIGKGPDSSYMKDVCEPLRKHLFIKKSDAEGTDFYYMGQFDILEVCADFKKDNSGKMKDISKVKMKLHDPVRVDLKEYLEAN
jgi:superfamily II DNA or RNA helicase